MKLQVYRPEIDVLCALISNGSQFLYRTSFFLLVLILILFLLAKYFCIFVSYCVIFHWSIFCWVLLISDFVLFVVLFLLLLIVFIAVSLEVTDCFHSQSVESYYEIPISSLSVLIIIPIFFIFISESSLPLWCFTFFVFRSMVILLHVV